MFKSINDQTIRDIQHAIANATPDEPLAAELIPIAMNNAVNNEDLLNMLASHYAATLHVLASAHEEHDVKPTGLIVVEVDGLISDAFSQVRENVIRNPKFYELVRKSAEQQNKQLNAAND